MGHAAYMRGSKALRGRIDSDIQEARARGVMFMVAVEHPKFLPSPVVVPVVATSAPSLPARVWVPILDRCMRVGPANRHQCEVCHKPTGVQLNRGFHWSDRLRVWINTCLVCSDYVRMDNQQQQHYKGGR
jgi:hypothetical protein